VVAVMLKSKPVLFTFLNNMNILDKVKVRPKNIRITYPHEPTR